VSVSEGGCSAHNSCTWLYVKLFIRLSFDEAIIKLSCYVSPLIINNQLHLLLSFSIRLSSILRGIGIASLRPIFAMRGISVSLYKFIGVT
jgi:hypothetical protein